jgi:hypothetical protein
MSSGFTFTTQETDIIILGASNIIRTASGTVTTFTYNTFMNVDNSLRNYVIQARISSGGILDLHTLLTNNLSVLQSVYPSLYSALTSPFVFPTVTSTSLIISATVN